MRRSVFCASDHHPGTGGAIHCRTRRKFWLTSLTVPHLSGAVPGHLFRALLVGVVPAVLALHALLDHTHQHLAAEVALGRLRVPSKINSIIKSFIFVEVVSDFAHVWMTKVWGILRRCAIWTSTHGGRPAEITDGVRSRFVGSCGKNVCNFPRNLVRNTSARY